MTYDAFISYRRETANGQARAIQIALQTQGKRCFLDVVDLGRGFFDETLLEYVAQIPNFIVILSAGALDRCVEPQDWMRLEIEQALLTGSNLVPVVLPEFRFPDGLPTEIRDLKRHQWVDYSNQYFDAMVAKIVQSLAPPTPVKRQFLPSLPNAPQPAPASKWYRAPAPAPIAPVRTAPLVQPKPAPPPPAQAVRHPAVRPPGLDWRLCAALSILPFFWWFWLLLQVNYAQRIDPRHNPRTPAVVGIVLFMVSILLTAFLISLNASDDFIGMAFWLIYFMAYIPMLIAAFRVRAVLVKHFNSVEPMGLKLSGPMTFFFNVVYFQYHFQRILLWQQSGAVPG